MNNCYGFVQTTKVITVLHRTELSSTHSSPVTTDTVLTGFMQMGTSVNSL